MVRDLEFLGKLCATLKGKSFSLFAHVLFIEFQ